MAYDGLDWRTLSANITCTAALTFNSVLPNFKRSAGLRNTVSQKLQDARCILIQAAGTPLRASKLVSNTRNTFSEKTCVVAAVGKVAAISISSVLHDPRLVEVRDVISSFRQ